MKRFSTTEKGLLVLASLLILVGLFAIVSPREFRFAHPANRPAGGGATTDNYIESVSKDGMRWYGFGALAFGFGMIFFLKGPKEK